MPLEMDIYVRTQFMLVRRTLVCCVLAACVFDEPSRERGVLHLHHPLLLVTITTHTQALKIDLNATQGYA